MTSVHRIDAFLVPALLMLASSACLAGDENQPPNVQQPASRTPDRAYCGDASRSRHPGPRDADDFARVIGGARDGAFSCEMLLGSWYGGGLGVRQDFNEARRWYVAAAQDSPAGWVALGRMAEGGHGGEPDFAEARKDYELAAAKNDGSAEMALGHLYERGLGVPADLSTAVDWYRKSAHHDDDEAWAALDRIEAGHAILSPEQVIEDRNYWKNTLSSRIGDMAEDIVLMRSLDQTVQFTFLFQFSRGAPNLVVKLQSGSGDPALDRALTEALTKLQMPAAPIFQNPDQQYRLLMPMTYQGAGDKPAPATHAAAKPPG